MTTPDLHIIEGDNPARVSLYALAKNYLDDYDGSVHDATNALVEHLQSDPFALSVIVQEAVSEAVKTAVAYQHRKTREDVIRIYNKPHDVKAAVVLGQDVHRELLLNFPLEGGLLLRDAHREDVLKNASRYQRLAKTHAHRGLWLQAIANRMSDDTHCVKDILSENDVQRLYEEASHAA
jgi:hypothetical protein